MNNKNKSKTVFLVLGDQLTTESTFFSDFNAATDVVWMAEVKEESTHVWTHKARIVMFLSSMRHFKEELKNKGYPFSYTEMNSKTASSSLEAELSKFLKSSKPTSVKIRKPGEHRVEEILKKTVIDHGFKLEITEDDHFLCTTGEFALHAKDRKQLRMEYFYREMRKKYKIRYTSY